MGRRTQRLLRAIGVVTAALLAIWGAGGPEDGIDAARQFVTFLARGTAYEAASWLKPEVLAAPARVLALMSAMGIMVWVFWPERKAKKPEDDASAEVPTHPPTVRELFDNELRPTSGTTLTYLCASDIHFSDETKLEYWYHIICDFSAHAKYVSYYLPPTRHAETCILAIMKETENHVDFDLHAEINSANSEVGPIDEKTLTFTRKVYFYFETDLNPSQLGRIFDACQVAKLQPEFRGPRYALRQAPFQHQQPAAKLRVTLAQPYETQRTLPSPPAAVPKRPSRRGTAPRRRP